MGCFWLEASLCPNEQLLQYGNSPSPPCVQVRSSSTRRTQGLPNFYLAIFSSLAAGLQAYPLVVGSQLDTALANFILRKYSLQQEGAASPLLSNMSLTFVVLHTVSDRQSELSQASCTHLDTQHDAMQLTNLNKSLLIVGLCQRDSRIHIGVSLLSLDAMGKGQVLGSWSRLLCLSSRGTCVTVLIVPTRQLVSA